ncbi:MAG: membrane protein insertase YidC [Ottowia sp.]|nr:membrane protein insertase YidC [Ottowia sp.]
MNDIRRTVLWVVFVFSLLMLWSGWQRHQGRPGLFEPPSATQAAAPGAPGSAAVPANIPSASTALQPPSPAAAASAATPAESAGEHITVTTDVLKLTFDTAGGSLVHSEFLQHKGADGKPFVLMDNTPPRMYQAQSGLIGGAFPTHKTLMRFSGERALRDGQNELQLRFEAPETGGARLVKTYTLRRGSYVMDVRHDISNSGESAIAPQLYLQLARDSSKPEGEGGMYSTFTGPAFYSADKKFQKVPFADIAKGSADFVHTASDGWVAMVQHYFASAWLPPEGTPRENFARHDGGELYSAGALLPVGDIAPGATRSVDTRLFAGPQEETMLEGIAPGLELVKDYGWFTILAKPLYKLLGWLHRMLGNWGWAIVALVVLLKIAFYWLNAKAYENMAKMKTVGPRITQLRERYANNPQQMQQEIMRIYREEKVNPMGGCLPIMVQIPVFIALYWVLLSSVEMRGAPWIGWIHDLSARDPYFILPILMTLTTLLQTALNPQPPDPVQAKMMWLMPLMFSVMFFFFPSGLVLYWLTNNILTIVQQWIINRRMGVPVQFNLPKF